MGDFPELVSGALRSAGDHDFPLSCEEPVGRLLAVLAAAVPPGGRVLELGTGAGVGAAWLASGLGDRDDVALLTVEQDPGIAALAAALPWPPWVDLRVGDAVRLLPELGEFDLVFADAEGGKWSGLHLTIGALRPGGLLVVDDMDPARYALPEHRERVGAVRARLLSDPTLACAELPAASGIMIAARKRP